jgi:co-chaperonin GroES (HSP10)
MLRSSRKTEDMQQATKVKAEKRKKVILDIYSGNATGRDGLKYFLDKPADVLMCVFSVQTSGRITVL